MSAQPAPDKPVTARPSHDTYRASHPVAALPTTLFEDHPNERSQYEALKARLLKQLRPEGELELQTFERYTYAVFAAERLRKLELTAQDRWLENPDDHERFLQMERLIKLATSQERRADQALKEFRRQQMDRFQSLDVAHEIYLAGKFIPIPGALPVSEMRARNCSAPRIAFQIMSNQPKTMAILRGDIPGPPRRSKTNEPNS